VSNQKIFLVSGPVGVGKSTTSKSLAQKVENCILIEGDTFLHMFEYGAEASWETSLRLAWENILHVTKRFIQNGYKVVIDFVVEDELEWFNKQISDLQVTLNYIVLRAEKETLIERINKRGDIELIDRALFLLEQLESSPQNHPYLLDTNLRNTEEIVDEILHNPHFVVDK